MIELHLHENGNGHLTDSTDLVYGEASHNPISNSWDVTIKNNLDEDNPLRAVDIQTVGWVRGRFDTYRGDDPEPKAKGRAFGRSITTDIIPGETLRLHITQDPPPAVSTWVPPKDRPKDEIDIKAKLVELQAQINELAKDV